MGYVNMDVSPVNEGDQAIVAWEKLMTLDSVSTGDWVLIPDSIGGVTVTVSFTDSAEGKVQTTTDTVEEVKTGSPVSVDWALGAVSSTSQDRAEPVTAIRAVQTSVGGGSGTMKMTIRGQ